jgi:hypothetical protein
MFSSPEAYGLVPTDYSDEIPPIHSPIKEINHEGRIEEEFEYYFMVAMKAMNRHTIPDKEAINHLLKTVSRSQERVTLHERRQILLQTMPYVLKVVDIMENVSNRTFESEGHKSFTEISEASFVPRGGVVKKACEVITEYTPLEELFFHYLDEYNPTLPNLINIFDYSGQKVGGKLNSAIKGAKPFDPDKYKLPLSYFIAKRAVSKWKDIMPTQWGILTLLGLGPNDIFKPDPKGGLPVYK